MLSDLLYARELAEWLGCAVERLALDCGEVELRIIEHGELARTSVSLLILRLGFQDRLEFAGLSSVAQDEDRNQSSGPSSVAQDKGRNQSRKMRVVISHLVLIYQLSDGTRGCILTSDDRD